MSRAQADSARCRILMKKFHLALTSALDSRPQSVPHNVIKEFVGFQHQATVEFLFIFITMTALIPTRILFWLVERSAFGRKISITADIELVNVATK